MAAGGGGDHGFHGAGGVESQGAAWPGLAYLDCYWAGSLDFIFFRISWGSPLNPQKVEVFAEGSASNGLALYRLPWIPLR